MRSRHGSALVAVLLLIACGGSDPKKKTEGVSGCTDSPDCKVSAAELKMRDDLRAEQEQQRRGDRRGRERDLMTRKDAK
jgi:hypothetical protein